MQADGNDKFTSGNHIAPTLFVIRIKEVKLLMLNLLYYSFEAEADLKKK